MEKQWRALFSTHFIDEEIRPIKGRYLPTCGFFSFTSPRKGATHIGGSENGQYKDCVLWWDRSIKQVPNSWTVYLPLYNILNNSVLIPVLCLGFPFWNEISSFLSSLYHFGPNSFFKVFEEFFFSNQHCHHHDVGVVNEPNPLDPVSDPHQSNGVTWWATKHWAKEKILKCLTNRS